MNAKLETGEQKERNDLSIAERQAFTIDEFCKIFAQCSRGTFYNMVRAGVGPKLFYVGGKKLTKEGRAIPNGVRISREAAVEWLRAREEAAVEDARLKAEG